MGIKSFFKWTRDNQANFANDISKELAKKADTTQVQKMFAELPPPDDASKVSKNGDTMKGGLEIGMPPAAPIGNVYPLVLKGKFYDTSSEYIWKLGMSTVSTIFYLRYQDRDIIGVGTSIGIFPASSINTLSLGFKSNPWAKTITKLLNAGGESGDIVVPSKAGTLALLSDIEDALAEFSPPATNEPTAPQNAGFSIVDFAHGQSGTNYDRASFEEYANGRIDQRCRLHFGSFSPYSKSMTFNLPKEMPDEDYIAVATIKNKGSLGVMVEEQTKSTITLHINTFGSPTGVPDVYMDLVIVGNPINQPN